MTAVMEIQRGTAAAVEKLRWSGVETVNDDERKGEDDVSRSLRWMMMWHYMQMWG